MFDLLYLLLFCTGLFAALLIAAGLGFVIEKFAGEERDEHEDYWQ